jgi:transcriptional regulator with XRE-family HTH domain
VGEHEWWTERPAEAAFAKALARAIRVLRTELGMSRKELAERADLSYSYLSELENAAKQPSSRALRAVAQALGLEANELLAAAETRVGEVPESDLSEDAPAEAETEELRTTLRAAGYPVRSRRGRREGRSWFREGPAMPLMARLRAEKPRAAALPETGVQAMVDLEEQAPALAETLEELRRLLEALSPEDRERVLDLARRLRAE